MTPLKTDRIEIAARLLSWFDQAKRDMPWRSTRDPYAVLVSELMLQQTQVTTVIPYYLRFIDRFPTLDALAAAEESEVLRLWSGLGYYRRARNLHAFAREVVKGLHGKFPQDRRTLLSLPGVGPYTAGAVLSIAFNQPEPLVDGNVERVLTRLFLIKDNVAAASGKRAVWKLADELVPSDRPGDFNQALMELGATICTPGEPRCLCCPVSSLCRGYSEGVAGTLPVKAKATRKEKVEEVVLILWEGGRVLLTEGNEQGLYQGMRQLPWTWRQPEETGTPGALHRLAARFGIKKVDVQEAIHELSHGVTFRSIHTEFYALNLKEAAARKAADETGSKTWWIDSSSVLDEALPAYQRKALRRILEQ